MVENKYTYTFSQIDKILKIVPRLDEHSWFPFSRVPEPILSPLTVIYLSRRKVTKHTIRIYMNVNVIIRMGSSWIDHYCTDPNRDPDTHVSKNYFFMY